MPAAVQSPINVAALAVLFNKTRTESGAQLMDLLERSPLLVVFLRHAGCTFCREALSDIARDRAQIERSGTKIVLVHMGDRPGMDRAVRKYGLSDVEMLCDPDHEIYSAFGLKRGTIGQVLGPKVMLRGIVAGIFRGHGVSLPQADPLQMPGVFYLERGMLVRRFRHQYASDRPSYTALCSSGEEPHS